MLLYSHCFIVLTFTFLKWRCMDATKLARKLQSTPHEGMCVHLQYCMCFLLAMYITGANAQMPWEVTYGRWLIRAQMEDMNQRRRGEETINVTNGNPPWEAQAIRPSAAVAVFICGLPLSLNKPPKRPLACCSQDTHKAPQQVISTGASYRVCRRRVVVMWETWGSDASKAEPCTCFIHIPLYQGMTLS